MKVLKVFSRLAPDPAIGMPGFRSREGEYLAVGPVPSGVAVGCQIAGGIELLAVIVIEPNGDLFVVLQVEVIHSKAEVIVAELVVGQGHVGARLAIWHGRIVAFADMRRVIACAAQEIVDIR